jgi:hypothetical protein
MDYDAERITDRRNIARIKMEAQVAADAIKGELCNYVRETADEHTIRAVRDLATTNPLVYKYIRRLESINNNIYCTNCDRVKHVTGFNESNNNHSYNDELFEQQCINMHRKIDNLAAMIKELYDNYTANKQQIEEYFTGLVNELSECKKAVDLPLNAPKNTSKSTPSMARAKPQLRPQPAAPEVELLRPQTYNSGTLDDIFKPLMQFDDDGMF